MQRTIETISEEKLKKAIETALARLDESEAALPFRTSLTSVQRQHTSGKWKNGEDTAIDAVIATVQNHGAAFAGLGMDARHVRDLAARRALIQPIAARAQQLAESLNDTVLSLGEAIKDAISPAYHFGAALAQHDPAVANDLQPAQQFYQNIGRSAARARKAKHAQPPPA
jgi:hypothetical protein